jgi:nicotinamide riboside transporter PnuC
MDTFSIFTWCLTAVTIYGTLLNSQRKKVGFLIWGLCNMAWLCVDASRGIWAQCGLYTVFIAFNIYGWMNWTAQEKESAKEEAKEEAKEKIAA